MGGRLLARCVWILEGPTELLGERGLLQRQDLLVKYPQYSQLAQEASQIRAKLAEKPLVAEDLEARREQSSQLAALAEIGQKQEMVLRQIAVRREPAEMVFPPVRKAAEVQQSLGEGQVLLAFFATSHNLYAFLYGRERYAAWTIHSAPTLQKQVTNLLRKWAIGTPVTNCRQTTLQRRVACHRHQGDESAVGKIDADLAGGFSEIAIVPDGYLWYLPFEALSIGKGEHERLLISQARA